MNWTTERIQEVHKYAASRDWTPLARECFVGAEELLRKVLRSASGRLPEADRLAFQVAEQEIGKGKGVESFTLGQLVGLIREAQFFDKWEKASARNLSAVKTCNLKGLNDLRNALAHDGRRADQTEAVHAYVFFKSCLDAFALQGETLPDDKTIFGYVPAFDSDLWDRLPAKPEPFKLLTWRTQLASFIGRQQELDDLLKWACDSNAHPRVRILTGNGGAGKTRLAATVCSLLRKRGWKAEFLPSGQVNVMFSDEPSLHVVDYPEERKDEVTSLFDALKRIQFRSTPLRILFLTRKREEWWQTTSFLGALRVDGLFDTAEIYLSKLSKDEATTLFSEAYEKVRSQYALSSSSISKDQILNWYSRNEQLNSSPLFITATAIHCALDGDAGLSLGGPEVVQALVQRERKRLGPIGSAVGLEYDAVSRLVALAGIPGRIDSPLLRRLADPALEIGLPPANQVVNTLRRTAVWNNDRISAASPDICAASLLFSALDDRRDMASEWLWTVLQDVKQGLPDLLGRLSRDISLIHPSKTKQIGDGEDNREKLPAARQFAEWLIEILRRDPQRAKHLEKLLTEFRPPVSVLPVAVEVGLILTVSPELDENKHACRLHCLAERLWESGRFKEAQAPIEDAVTLRRKLCHDQPSIKVELGESLNAQTLILSALNKDDDAIRAVNEGVAILREAASKGDVDSLHALGRCLNAKHTVYMGKDSAIAREAVNEVVALYESLSKAMPERFSIWLARGFHNLSNCEDDIQTATDLLGRAVALKRHLAEKEPWRYENDFALSAALMVERLLNLQKIHDALQLSEEVLTIYTRLFEVNPTRFASDLLNASAVHESILERLGRKEQALDSETKRVKLMEHLLSIRETAIDDQQQIELLMSLVTIANHAAHLRRYDEARRACDKVLEIATEIKLRNPDVWNPNLHFAISGAYLNRGNARYGGETKEREALHDYSAAISLCDEFEVRSGANEQNSTLRLLAQANKAIDLFKSGQSEEAQFVVKSVIDGEQRLRREFGENHYSNHETELVKSLRILIERVIALENRELIDGVAGILLRLAEMAGANVSMENLQEQASWRLVLGDSLMQAGCEKEALTLLKDGVDLGRQAVSNREHFSDIEFLNNLGYCMARLQEQDEGRSHFDEVESYIVRAKSLLKADDDYLRSITSDSLGYVQALKGRRQKNPEVLKEAIRNFEEARRSALKINRQDLLPALDKHMTAAHTALNDVH